VEGPQARLAVDHNLVLTPHRLQVGLELELQGFSLGDREAHDLTLHDRPRVLCRSRLRRKLRVCVVGQLLGQVVADKHPPLAQHGQFANLRRRQPVHLKNAQDSALELQERVEDVLVVGMDPLLGLGVQPLHISAGEMTHDVEVMRGEVDDHADVADASRERPEPPRLDLKNPADLAECDASLQLSDRRVETLDVADRKHAIGAPRRSQKLAALFEVGRDRLLDEDMEAALQHREAGFEMEACRHGDDGRIQLLAVEHLIPRAVPLYRVFVTGRVDDFPIHVADGGQRDVV